jgi:hypothetical protein
VSEMSGLRPWSNQVATLSATFGVVQKQLRGLPENCFDALRQVNGARNALQSAGIKGIELIDSAAAALEGECLRSETEFWGLLTEACSANGWDLFGSTNRRLVCQAVFVSQDGRSVKIEGQAAIFTPDVANVMGALGKQFQDIECSESELNTFLELLTRAYDMTPKIGSESNLEELFRRCVIEFQKPSFWRNPVKESFVSLTRPAFRFRLSELLRKGMTTPDGRAISLGSTTTTKDAWEVFSPGEQRVVLAGRLSFASVRRDHVI